MSELVGLSLCICKTTRQPLHSAYIIHAVLCTLSAAPGTLCSRVALSCVPPISACRRRMQACDIIASPGARSHLTRRSLHGSQARRLAFFAGCGSAGGIATGDGVVALDANLASSGDCDVDGTDTDVLVHASSCCMYHPEFSSYCMVGMSEVRTLEIAKPVRTGVQTKYAIKRRWSRIIDRPNAKIVHVCIAQSPWFPQHQ